MALQITDANVKELIESGKPLVIDCWATWCGPCKAMAPMIDELAAEYEGRVTIGKYNCEEETELSDDYQIMALPTFLFFKDGKLVQRAAGSQKKETMVAKIEALL